MSDRRVAVSFSRTAWSIRPYCVQISRQKGFVVSRTAVSVHDDVNAVLTWAVAGDDAVTTHTSSTKPESSDSRSICVWDTHTQKRVEMPIHDRGALDQDSKA